MFNLKAEDGLARIGILNARNGRALKTPSLLPVATYGTVKTLTPQEVWDLGFEGIIVNSFLINLLSPMEGEDVDLHRYLSWDGVIFADSGGFQLVRKGFLLDRVSEGFKMRDPFSGRVVDLTAEVVVEYHRRLKVDFGMVLDDCPPYPWKYDEVLSSTERTLRWAGVSMGESRGEVELLAIVQGGGSLELRRRCAEELSRMGYRGFGIGGLSIGEPKEVTWRITEETVQALPHEAMKYLMGVGEPEDIVKAVSLGVDIFDSTYPARGGRHGTYLTPEGKVNLNSGGFRGVDEPIHRGCTCPVCRQFSRDFLYHLKKGKEMLLYRLGTLHNLYFISRLMEGIRRSIKEGEFSRIAAGGNPVKTIFDEYFGGEY